MPRGIPKNSIVGPDDANIGFDLGTQAPPELRDAEITADDIQVIAAKDMNSAVNMEKFMNEKVVVQIEDDPEDENAPVFVYVGHNGVTQYIHRGTEQVIKRKFLYAALVSKRVKMACAFGKDGTGNEFNRLTPSASMTHRIHLVRDDNPQGGMKWVQSVMRASA